MHVLCWWLRGVQQRMLSDLFLGIWSSSLRTGREQKLLNVSIVCGAS